MFPLRREASLTLDSTSDRCKEQLPITILLPPANEVAEGNVFTGVCHSVHGGVYAWSQVPSGGWVCLVPCPFWGQVGGGWGGHTRGQVYQREWVYKRGWGGYIRRQVYQRGYVYPPTPRHGTWDTHPPTPQPPSSTGHHNTCGWQAGSMHPTGTLSSVDL